MNYAADELRPVLRAMTPGETCAFPVPEGMDRLTVRGRLNRCAGLEWGKGTFSAAFTDGAVLFTRKAPLEVEKQVAGRQGAAPPAIIPPGGLSREQAAAWISPWFPGGVTAAQLSKLASRGVGPRFYRAGRVAIYFKADLAAWIPERIQPAPNRNGRS